MSAKRKEKLQKELAELKRLGIELNKWIDVTDDVYHNVSPGLSASGVKKMSKCMARFRYDKDNPSEKKSDPLLLGGALHMYILERRKFYDNYIIAPSSNKTKKEWKDFIKNISEEDSHKEVLRLSDKAILDGIVEAFKRKKGAGSNANIYDNLIHHSSTTREKALYTIDPERGILLKVKVDINFMRGQLYDLKSCKNASLEKFMVDAANYEYDMQGAFYLKTASLGGMPANSFGFIAVEKEAPYLSNGIIMHPEDLVLAEKKVNKLLDQYCWSIDNDFWPGYNGVNKQGAEPMFALARMPNWRKYNLEEMFNFKG